MRKNIILKSLERYFKEEKTDYAVMIAGEWGIGKTYFLQKEVFPLIEKQNKRSIYISLIGLNDVAYLENRVFENINPFYKSESRSALAIEADHIESIITETPNANINVPANLVFCFDDLERIKPKFFESAMGFINIFIEHYKINCIFLCNEEKTEQFKGYKTIKEKYIRYTYAFIPILTDVLEERILNIKANERDFYHIPTIHEMFQKGGCNNLRTLHYAISIFEQFLSVLNTQINHYQHKNEIIHHALTYCCFYCIESKKGTTHELLDKVTIARSPIIISSHLDHAFNNTGINESKDQDNTLIINDDSVELERIQQMYFSENSINFEKFYSIATLVKEGYLDPKKTEKEATELNEILEKRKQNIYETELVNSLDDFYNFSDNELLEKIKYVVLKVKGGRIRLDGFLQLYRNLVWFESLGIEGIEVDDDITNSFKEGVKMAYQNGILEYIQNLNFQFQWSKDDKNKFAKKYDKFKEFVIQINDNLNTNKYSQTFENISTSISDNNISNLIELLSPDNKLMLTENDARIIYDNLVEANTKTIGQFTDGLYRRYADEGRTVSYLLEKEKNFLFRLYSLLAENNRLQPENKKKLREVALMFLKNSIWQMIEKDFPQNDKIANEK